MAAGGGARLPPSADPASSAADASIACRLTSLPCARYELRLSKRLSEGPFSAAPLRLIIAA
jgi:hypothetical protein